MKKVLKRLLLCLLTLALVFNCGFVFAEETPTSTEDVRNQGQGANNWFYCYGSPEIYSLMEFGSEDLIPAPHWYGPEIYQYITTADRIVNPGMKTGVLLVWVAEFDGSINVSGKILKPMEGGDGCSVSVLIGGKTELSREFGAEIGEEKVSLTNKTISRGETVMFYVNNGHWLNNGYDAVNFNCSISWVQTSGSKLSSENVKKSLTGLTDSYTEVLGINIIEQTDYESTFTTEYVNPKDQNYLPKEEEILDEYDYVRDFSNKQGYRGWYYYYGDTGAELHLMTYHEDFGMYKGSDYWSRLSIHDNIPGLTTETVIGFRVPKDCIITATITIFRNPPAGFMSGQDGVWFFGYKNQFNSEELLFSENVVDYEYTLHNINYTEQVKKGDMLYFGINPNNNQNCDNCVININLKLK